MSMEVNEKQSGISTKQFVLRGWMSLLILLLVVWGGWIVYTIVSSKGKVNPIRLWISSARSAPKTLYVTPKYKYFRTFQHALDEAKRRKKNIFLDLYAVWCYPCKKLERETFSHPTVRKLLKSYLAVKFNIDKSEGKKLVRRYRIHRFPTTLMIAPNGREIERIVGFYPPKFFRPAVKDALTPHGNYWAIKKRWRRHSNDLALTLKLADRALLRRSIREARQLYTRVLHEDKLDKQGFGSRSLFGLARSRTRVGQYKNALPLLARLHKNYPKSSVRADAYRLELYCLYKLKKNIAYHRTFAMFRKAYPGQSTKFE